VSHDSVLVLLAVVGGGLLLLIIASLCLKMDGFFSRLSQLNAEIRRTEGHERAHYKKRRRQLWLSLLPFTKKRS